MNLLLKLLIVHLVGDFLLQPKSWVDDKEQRKIKSTRLYFHILIHLALTLLVVWRIDFWKQALVICGTHFIIDLVKTYVGKNKAGFFIDQLLHILIIILVWYFSEHPTGYLPYIDEEKSLIVALALIFVTMPVGIIVKTIISKWEFKINTNANTPSLPAGQPQAATQNEALESAGLWIGIMERFLVVVFILLSQWGAIGFLLASKSVFRFGDLRQANDRKLTEYILIGTLLSFGIAIVTGILANYLLNC